VHIAEAPRNRDITDLREQLFESDPNFQYDGLYVTGYLDEIWNSVPKMFDIVVGSLMVHVVVDGTYIFRHNRVSKPEKKKETIKTKVKSVPLKSKKNKNEQSKVTSLTSSVSEEPREVAALEDPETFRWSDTYDSNDKDYNTNDDENDEPQNFGQEYVIDADDIEFEMGISERKPSNSLQDTI